MSTDSSSVQDSGVVEVLDDDGNVVEVRSEGHSQNEESTATKEEKA